MSTPPRLILVKGAPGVGKSSAARELSKHCPNGVRVEVDTLRNMVINVNWKRQAEHRAVLSLGAQLALGFLRSGFAPVILIDTFSGDKLDGFIGEIRETLPKERIVVAALHASDTVLRQRVLGREASGFRDLEICAAINEQVARGQRPSETLIDTSSLSPIQVADAIRAAAGLPDSPARMDA